MKVIIIDDERKARSVLKMLLTENCSKITQILEADTLLKGVEIIKKEEPKIVFLDIEMPEHSGLEIFNFLDKDVHDFEIIFTTAYSDYAIRAFQLSAIEYLLKPLQVNKLCSAVDKAVKMVGKSEINKRLIELKSSFDNGAFKKIGLPYSDGIRFVNFEEILFMEADGMYTNVYLQDENTILVSKPLKFFVEALKEQQMFYKPHRSFLVNLAFIKEYIKKDGGYIIMENNKSVSLSKDKREEFLQIIQTIS